MKQITRSEKLKWLTLGAGVLGFLLRLWLYAAADGRGLLKHGHPAYIGVFVLTAVVLIALAVLTHPYKKITDTGNPFPASWGNSLTSLLLAGVILYSSMQRIPERFGLLGVLRLMLGIIAVFSLLYNSWERMRGGKTHFLLFVCICIYFMADMICSYQSWSSDPQLMDYCFQMFAEICLILAVYHRAAFEIGIFKHHAFWFYSLAAVYFCCLSAAKSPNSLLFLAAGAWTFTGLSQLSGTSTETDLQED